MIALYWAFAFVTAALPIGYLSLVAVTGNPRRNFGHE